jgi:uncharacterized protein (TIGR00251 family)
VSGVVIPVRVTPRAGRDEIAGVSEDGTLRVRVAAPPAEGAANAAVTRLLARALHVPHGAVSVVSGAHARQKRLRVEGVAADEVRAQWPGLSLRPA